MARKKTGSNTKLKGEVMKNRMLIGIIGMLSVLSILMLLSIWLDISPYAIIPTPEVVYDENAQTVYVPEEFATIWDSRYISDRAEFIYCLHGREFEDGYLITSMRETEVVYADEEAISYKACEKSPGYLGTVHSHPQPERSGLVATCSLSKQDIYTFGADRATITGVICGEKKYGFYAPGEFDVSMNIAIVEFDG